MGNLATNILRKTKKPIRDFNLDSRIDKVLDKEKPISPPVFPQKFTPEMEEQMKGVKEALKAKDDLLLDRLKQVYVKSEKDNPVMPKMPDRALPVARTDWTPSKFGYRTPKEKVYGKTTLEEVLKFLALTQESPEVWDANRIAEEHKLDEKTVEKVMQHFSTLTLVVQKPESENDQPQLFAFGRIDIEKFTEAKKNAPPELPSE